MLPPDMYHLAKIVVASSILAGVPVQAVTEITYWLWDNNQLASYQGLRRGVRKAEPGHKNQNHSGPGGSITGPRSVQRLSREPLLMFSGIIFSRYPEFYLKQSAGRSRSADRSGQGCNRHLCGRNWSKFGGRKKRQTIWAAKGLGYDWHGLQ